MAYTSKYTGQLIDNMFESMYPVGAVYISFNDVSPAGTYGGTWERLEDGYTLWSASSGAGDTISAGLPKLWGEFLAISTISEYAGVIWNGAGVFNVIRHGATWDNSMTNVQLTSESSNSSNSHSEYISFDASRYNSIYGNSNTVQPPAYKVYMWKRVS